jgi:hypothetical protein
MATVPATTATAAPSVIVRAASETMIAVRGVEVPQAEPAVNGKQAKEIEAGVRSPQVSE